MFSSRAWWTAALLVGALAPWGWAADLAGEIVFISSRGSGMHVLDLATGTVRNLPGIDEHTDFEPHWSPDGRQILFVSDRAPAPWYDLFVVNADGSNTTNITNSLAWEDHPNWSPDGTRIATYRHREGQIRVMNADGSDSRPMFAGCMPSWSPDGRRIAFDKHPGGTGQIYIADLDGGNEEFVVQGAFPAWSPDGTRILYTLDGKHKRSWLHVIHLETGEVTKLGVPTGGTARPGWSPDGRYVIYSSRDPFLDATTDIYVIPAEGGARQRITTTGKYNSDPSWHGRSGLAVNPRGSRLATWGWMKGLGLARSLPHY